MIKVSNLTKYYGSFCAVSNLNFTIEKGHIYGLLGRNGAGKTTTMNMLTGVLASTEGNITVAGFDMLTEPERAKAHIGYLPENPPLYNEFTPFEYLTFVARAKNIPKDQIRSQVHSVIDETMLSSVKNKLIRNLSKGYRQRVGIAQAMLGSPDVIILDEPTVGLDPLQVVQIRELIKKLAKSRTVIISSHILSEIEELCDRIMIISQGRLVAIDTPENLQRQYASNDILTINASCKAQRAGEILNYLRSVYKITVEDDAQRGCNITVVCPKRKDPRESIFFAFAKAGVAILSMNYSVVTLEDVFLRATNKPEPTDKPEDTPETSEASSEDTPSVRPVAKAEKQKKIKKAEEEDDDDGDNYRPLFG